MSLIRGFPKHCGRVNWVWAVKWIPKLPKFSEAASLGEAHGIGSGCYWSGAPFKTHDEIKGNLNQPGKASPHYTKRMQRHTGPVMPFEPFMWIVAETVLQKHGYTSGLKFCPSALQVLCAMLGDYMHELFQAAHDCVHNERSCERKIYGYRAASDPDV